MDFALQLEAGELFRCLQALADKRLAKGTTCDLAWFGAIEFPTDEEAHNDALQAAATALADALLALVVAGARTPWGEPDYELSAADDALPAWTEDLVDGPGFLRLVGWRRGRTLVAFALRQQEDREVPVTVSLGVVRWRAGAIAYEQ
jgi:hypothetical protein